MHYLLATLILFSSCSTDQLPKSTASKDSSIQSLLTYRITPQGEKELEHYTEYDSNENPVFERDYMTGEIYMVLV